MSGNIVWDDNSSDDGIAWDSEPAVPAKPELSVGKGVAYAPVGLGDTFTLRQAQETAVQNDPNAVDAANREVLTEKGFAAASRDARGDMVKRKATVKEKVAAAKQTGDAANEKAKKGEGIKERSLAEGLQDLGTAGEQGLLNINAGVSWGLDQIPGVDTSNFTASQLEASKLLEQEKSDYAQSANKAVQEAEGFTDTMAALLDNPAAVGDVIAQNASFALPGLAAGAAGAKVGGAMAARKAAQVGATEEAAAAAVMGARATGATVGGMSGEAATSGAMSGAQVESEILAMPFADLEQKSARFRELSTMKSPEAAREQLADEVSLATAALTGGATLAGGVFANKINKLVGLGDPYAGALVRQVTAKGALKNTVGETTQEMLQSPAEQIAGNVANVDDNQALTDGVGKSIAMGAVGAVGQSGAMNAAGYAMNAGKPVGPAGGLTPAAADAVMPPPQSGANVVQGGEAAAADALRQSAFDQTMGDKPMTEAELLAEGEALTARANESAVLAEEARAIGDAELAAQLEAEAAVAGEAAAQTQEVIKQKYTGLTGIANRHNERIATLSLSQAEVDAGQLDTGNRAELGLGTLQDNEELQPVQNEQATIPADQATVSPEPVPAPVTAEASPIAPLTTEAAPAAFDPAQPITDFTTAKEQDLRRRMQYLAGAIKVSKDNAALQAEKLKVEKAIDAIGKAPATTEKSPVAGDKINAEWTAFAPESGTLSVPRAEMPQIKAEHRGAMVNFLKARGITSDERVVKADSLKPTQAEFSPGKVEKAKSFTGGDRSILVSSDNHILDGHHQWLAKQEAGKNVKVIRLGAPIKSLLSEVAEFPSATTDAMGADDAPVKDDSPVIPADKRDGEGLPPETMQQKAVRIARMRMEGQLNFSDREARDAKGKALTAARQAGMTSDEIADIESVAENTAESMAEFWAIGAKLLNEAVAERSAGSPEARKADRRQVDTPVSNEQRTASRRVDEMTPEEMRQALLVNPLTDLSNKRAFEEDADLGWEHVAAMDIDGFGFLNDIWGHDPVDAILKQIGAKMADFSTDTVRLYHRSGDEFAARSNDKEALQLVLKSLQDILKASTFTVDAIGSGGEPLTLIKHGIGVTYGISTDYQRADNEANADKERRLASGDRSAKGSNPGGMVEVDAQGNESSLGERGLSKQETQRLRDRGSQGRVSQEASDPEQEAANRIEDQRQRRSEQMRARNAAAAIVNPKADDLLAAVAKLGGISRKDAKEQGIDPADFDRRGHGIKRVFTSAGKSMDGMAESLHELGYPVVDDQGRYSANQLLDVLSDALSGKKIYTPDGDYAAQERADIQRALEQGDVAALPPSEHVELTQAVSINSVGFIDVMRAGFDAETVARMVGDDGSDADIYALFNGLINGDSEYVQQYQDAARAVEENAANLAGRPDDSGAAQEEQDDFPGFGKEEQADDLTDDEVARHLNGESLTSIRASRQADDFSLETQSEADLAAKEAREQDSAAAEEADRTRQIDASSDNFTMSTGIGTAGEQVRPAVRGGGRDMFASPAPTGTQAKADEEADTSTEGDGADLSKRSVAWLQSNGGMTISVPDALSALAEKRRLITEDKGNWSKRDADGHPVSGIFLYTNDANKKLDAIGFAVTNLLAHQSKHGDAPLRKSMEPAAPQNAANLSSVIDAANKKHGKGLTDADRVPQTVSDDILSIEADLWGRLTDGEASVDEFRAGFDRWVSGKEEIKTLLSKKTKKELLEMAGGMLAYRYKNDAKPAIVDAIWRDGAAAYVLGQSITYGMGKDSYINAVRAIVENTDADALAQYAAEHKAATDAANTRAENVAEAIKDPKTLEDFNTWMRAKMSEGNSFTEARMSLTPEQRVTYDELAAERTRDARIARKQAIKTAVRTAGQAVGGEIIATKHTRDNYDLFVVQLAERLGADDYKTVLESAKKLGGWYSAYRGNGATPGFQFKEKASAEAFLKLAAGDSSDAQAQAEQRRDIFNDDRSQTAVERLTEMSDRLDQRANESLGAERKANTARRARFAASAEAAASADKAMAKTMRNIATAISEGKAEFLDAVRQKVQVELLAGMVRTAKDNEIRAKFPTYAEQEKQKGAKPTSETADFAEFPSFTSYRSDLASLARRLLEVDGTKKIGQRLLKVADDVSDAYLEFAKANISKVSQFSIAGGMAALPNREAAERAISRSGLTGKAIVLPIKRGENLIVLSPSEAINRGIWNGDGDKRITLSREYGQELVEAISKKAKRNNLTVPWQLETAADRLKALSRMGIETPAEFRSALREFIALQEQPSAPSKVKEMERAMIGRRNDGLDFFPTPQDVADQMIEAAGIEPGMSVLEPSAGMGHIAERIQAAGVDPDVVELSGDRRELLEAKGFRVVGNDFLSISPREFFTFGDTFRAPDGTEGIMRGLGGMGSNRVRLEEDGGRQTYHDRDDLTGVRKNGTQSGYDRIIMNPPFGDRRDAEHVRHAYSLLKPGGRLVAIMGEGVFFGSDKKAKEFRDWLEEIGGTDEKLAENTFMDPSLPVNTGVSARMVVIEKPDLLYSLAYHGSPHRFDRFSVEHIGSGEGAQAYGWGLYFAGKREVAEFYRNSLSFPDFSTASVADLLEAIKPLAARNNTIYQIVNSVDDESITKEELKKSIILEMQDWWNDPELYDRVTDIAKKLKIKSTGQLYEVDIPDDVEFLLWDKPLMAQSEKVRSALEALKTSAAIDNNTRSVIAKNFDSMTGGALHNLLAVDDRINDGRTVLQREEYISKMLDGLGIVGVKYLDGSSRNRTLNEIKREFLDALPEDADFDEVEDLIGTGHFSPENDAILKALKVDGWLGFDYPSQAISAALSRSLASYDPSPELLMAVADAQEGGSFNYVIFHDDNVEITRTLYSKNRPAASAGRHADEVKQAIAPIIAKWKNGPRVSVVQSASDLPGGSAPHDVEGAYSSSGIVYLVADNLPTEQRLMEVLAHESIGHAAMESMLGKELMAELTREIQAWERRGSQFFVDLGKAVDESQPGLPADRRAKEIVALMAERGLHKQGGLWKRVTGAIRAFLRDMGFTGKWLASLTDADMFKMLADAERYLEDGRSQSGKRNAETALAFSRKGNFGSDRASWPDDFPRVVFAAQLGSAQKHVDYEAAKAGDIDAAYRLVRDTVSDDKVEEVKKALAGSKPVIVPVVAEEASGNNMIPMAYAEYMAIKLGLDTEPGIIQSERARRTGKGSDYRLGVQSAFDGKVRAGQSYLIVDDTMTMGGTLANLRGHIEANGGNVILASALTGFGQDGVLALTKPMRDAVWAKHGKALDDYLKGELGYGIDQLTQGEAGHFRKAVSLDAIRDRIAAARSAEGIDSPEGSVPSAEITPDEPLLSKSNPAPTEAESKIAAQKRRLARIFTKTPGQPDIVGDTWKLPEPHTITRKLFDRFDRFKQVQAAVVEQGGKVDTLSDVYGAEEAFHSRAASRIDRFRRHNVGSIFKRMTKAGVTPEDVGLYLYAQHAPERNAKIAELYAEGGQGDMLGGRDMQDGGSGMTNAEAAKIIADADARGLTQKLEGFANDFRAITKESRALLRDSGLESSEAIAAWESAYKKYVPLAGRDEAQDARMAVIGRGFDVRGGQKRAMGRKSKAQHIIEQILIQHEQAIIRAEKNLVGKRLLQFVKTNKDGKLWEVNPTEQRRYIAADGQVEYRVQPQRTDKNVVSVRINGKDTFILMADQLLADAFHNVGTEDLGMLLRAMSSLTRAMSMMFTSLSPAFVIVNAIRDIGTAMIHATQVKDAGYAARVVKGWPSAVADMIKDYRTGNSDIVKLYEQSGGRTGMVHMIKDLNEKHAETMAELYKLKGISTKEILDAFDIGLKDGVQALGRKATYNRFTAAFRTFLGWIEVFNGVVENATRLSAFKAALDDGTPAREAGSIAKNLTVNFNRKGELAPMLGALYIFFNAAVQGTMRMAQALQDRRVQGIALGIVATSYLLAAVQMGDDDDEDGKPDLEQIPAWQRSRNLIFLGKDGDVFKVPMPLGYNVFHTLGTELAIATGSKAKGSKKAASINVLKSVFDSFNPIGDAMPSVMAPFMDVAKNENNWGSPIYPDYNEDKPDSQRYYPGTEGTLIQKGTEALNEATGGSAYRAGMVDVSPESVEHVATFFGGGAWRFVKDSVESVRSMKAAGGTGVEADKAPIVRSFYSRIRDEHQTGQFYEGVKDVDLLVDEIKDLERKETTEGDAAADKLIAANPEVFALEEEAKNTRKLLKELKADERDIRGDDALSEQEKQTKLKELRLERGLTVKPFNRMYNESQRQTSK